MKNQNLLFLTAFLFALNGQFLIAQPCTDCWHWGGDPINDPNEEWIGTINKKNFVIRTWEFERAVVDTLGNVGIGKTDPLFRLDVIDTSNLLSDSATIVQLIGYFPSDSILVTGRYLSANPDAKVQVGIVGQSVKGLFANTGMIGYAADTTGSNAVNTGVSGSAIGSEIKNIGISGNARTLTGQTGVENIGVKGESSGSNDDNTGVYGTAVGGTDNNYGVAGYAEYDADSNNTTSKNIGIYGKATGSNNQNIGIDALAVATSTDSIGNIGVRGNASGDNEENTGIHGQATGGTETNYGVKGFAIDIITNPADERTNVGVHGFAQGSIKSNWGLFGSANYHLSDTICRLINAGVQANAQGSLYENRAGSFVTAYLDTPFHKSRNYSVWARSTSGEPPAPWGLAPDYYAGHFLGDVYVLGNIINQPTDFLPINHDSAIMLIPGDSALNVLSKLSPTRLYVDTNYTTYVGWHHAFDTDSVLEYLPTATRMVDRPLGYENICLDTIGTSPDVSIVHNEIIPLLVAGVNQLSSSQNIWQQTTTNVSLADSSKNVGIGISHPSAKLHLINATKSTGAIFSTTNFSNVTSIGMLGVAANPPSLFTISYFPPRGRIGVYGRANGSSNNFNIGGYFEAGPGVGTNYGIYARASSLSGFFAGSVSLNGNIFSGSDLTLKDSITDISPTSALATLAQLSPKSYVFKNDSFPYMNLPEGRQYGLISQQLDTITELENLVQEILQPEILDTDGTVLMDTMTFLGLNYTGLIPLTVSAINALSELKVNSDESATDSNYVTKWSSTNKTLTNSIMYDTGTRIGIGTTEPGGIIEIDATGDSVALMTKADTMGGYFNGGYLGAWGHADGGLPYQIGIVGTAENATQSNYGVIGLCQAETDTVSNVAISGIAHGSEDQNIGIRSRVFFESETASNYGVDSRVSGSGYENFAGTFITEGGAGNNIGVYCESPGYALFIEGDFAFTGIPYYVSDQRLKQNVRDIENATALLEQLHPKDYEFRTGDYPHLNLPAGKQYGLIAQEVEQIAPELIHPVIIPAQRDTSGTIIAPQLEVKGINYSGIIPLLISGMQQQQQTIDSLEYALTTRLAELESRMNNCCESEIQYRNTDTGENTQEEPHQLTVELSALQIVILEQNVPNPFKEQTSISYFVPEEAGKATMHFIDLAGRLIKTVELEKGSGIITVFAQTLGTGTYSYSLVVDGKVMETKKMVKTR